MALPKVGAHIKFRLYSGREAGGVVRAIITTADGRKLRVEYGSGPFVATINPEQLIQEGKPDAPEDVEL
jgi:hypothetical protein